MTNGPEGHAARARPRSAVVSSETDDAEDNVRSARRSACSAAAGVREAPSTFPSPSVVSADVAGRCIPIGWGALGCVDAPTRRDRDRLWTVDRRGLRTHAPVSDHRAPTSARAGRPGSPVRPP